MRALASTVVVSLVLGLTAPISLADDRTISVESVLADPSPEDQAARAAMLDGVAARMQQLRGQARETRGQQRRAVLPGRGELKAPENLERREISAGGRTREYFLFVPASVKGSPAPVVFALHGGAAYSGLQMHYKADYTVVAEREGFVVVYPSGVRGWNWNPGGSMRTVAPSEVSDVDDFAFFESMLDELIGEGIADPQRIYVTGGSNGGMMTYSLAHSLSERIAAVGVMVATMPKAAASGPRPAHPMPIVIMVGTRDPLMTWEGAEDRYSAQETVAYWRGFNRCVNPGEAWALPDVDAEDGTRVYAARWEGDAPVELYRMEGHGHGWPGVEAENNPTGPKTRDISAPEEFWSFLKEHSLSD